MSSQLTYPVRVEARLDENLSRWLWLVKWFLAIPHYVVLAFLWLAFVVSSVAAFFAILFTGSYPRAIFDFNVGVLRWNWRVAYYAYGALGTDRYPPFTLEEVAEYPVHLSIDYPEKLSRGLVLVKWWLLAIPHYIIVGLLAGGAWVAVEGDNWEVGGFGLISLLALVAGVILLFTGRYPAQLFDFLLGLNRWVLRVAAYAGLMTDVYPPFRLDSGGNEPGSAMTMQSYGSSSPAAGPVSGPSGAGISGADSGKTGWTSGPVISLVAGSLFGLMSFGVLAAAVVVFSVDGNREDGFVTTPSADFSTEAYAVVAEGLEVYLEGTDRVVPEAIIGDVRVDITGAEKPVFVGIARSSDVDRYLSGVSYSEVPDLSREDGRNLPATAGGGPSASPASQPFWAASSEGPGSREIRWPLENGTWSVVIMNADASPGLEFRGDVGAEVPILRPIYIGLFIVGNVLLVAAIVLIVAAVRRAGRKSSWVGP
jgi:hypothetical protein